MLLTYRVAITITNVFCSQTICQKSLHVFGRGPKTASTT